MNQSAMNILYKWCQLNRLSINLGKTKHMIVYKERIDSQELPILTINSVVLGNVQSYNHLGVNVVDILFFDKFVKDKYSKMYKIK